MSSSQPIALVTGASRGLGLETARQLAARGYRVISTSRDARAETEHWTLDVTDQRSVDAEVVRRTLAVNFFGTLDVTGALLPSMRDGGVIVMVSSGMGELSAFAQALRARFPGPRPHVEDGAASIVWAATHDDGGGQPTGGFFRDGHAISG